MQVEVHLAVAGDETRFHALAPEVFDRPIRADSLDAFLADPRHHLVYGMAGTALVGFISAVHSLHPDTPARLWINEVRVTPMLQRQGLGTRLMRRMLDHGAVLDCREAWGLADNDRMAAFYGAMGGRQGSYCSAMFTFPIGKTAARM